jgi:hypothetical protein
MEEEKSILLLLNEKNLKKMYRNKVQMMKNKFKREPSYKEFRFGHCQENEIYENFFNHI